MKYFTHLNAGSIDEAAAMLANGRARALAGGSDLLGALKDEILPTYPETVVNLKTIDGLDYITATEQGLTIGANTKLAAIAAAPAVQKQYPALAAAAKAVASPLIRNQATLGGNLCQDTRCWYYRYPRQVDEPVFCIRKGGEGCSAFTGQNRYHSIFGGMRVHRTACSESCPAHVDIPAYMERVRDGDLLGAARILLRNNPIPAVTSRVCAHFCQSGCHRNDYDAHLNIGQVERYLGDYILTHADELLTPPAQASGKRVAIVGAGPAGLTAAYYLRQQGHAVTVIEKMPEAGGLLMYAIPEYRLPKTVVRNLVKAWENMGIVFKCDTAVGQDVQLNDIVSQHDAMFLDTGAWKRTVIGIDGEELTRFGLEFLVEVKGWMQDKPGSNVVIVGGGNVAVDVAVTAKRLGAGKVTMVSLEQMDEMPASDEEMERALEDGVSHLGGWGPVKVLRKGGKVTGLELIRCVALRDENGRFAPQYDENQRQTINADAILLAVGQQTDLTFLADQLPLESQRGRLSVAETTQMTSQPGVFAGGDVTTGPSTVVMAVATGGRAAAAMQAYLTDQQKPAPASEAAGSFLAYNDQCLARSLPVTPRILPKAERGVDKEDDLGLPLEAVTNEAARCFNCSCHAVTPSDIATVLLSLDAVVRTNKRAYAAEEFFTRTPKVSDVLAPDEIVLAVEIPAPKAGVVMTYAKFRQRQTIDFAVVSVASLYEVANGVIQNAAIVLGAVAPVPVCAHAAETYLRGKVLNAETARAAAELAVADAKPLEQNAYKIAIAKTLVKRSLLNIL